MQRRSVVATLLAFGLGIASSACNIDVGADGGFSLGLATGRSQDTWTRSYTLAEGGRVELINVNGRITAEPASGTTLELVAERTAKASSDEAAKELLSRVEMREEAGDARVRVEVRSPRHFGPGGVEVRWTVKVPRGAAVDFRNTNGKVHVEGLAGEVHARTINGGVEARGISAQVVEASTVNGGVEVEIAAPLAGTGKVSLECVNGGVRLALPEASKASVVARVTNGGIDTGGLGFETTGEQTRRRFEGTLNGGGAPVRLETTNGGVHLSKSTS
jgi:hypothetical protein